MLTVSQDLVAQLTPYQNALNNTLDVATKLPLIGNQLADLQKWNTVFQDSLTSLASKVDSLTNGRFDLAVPLPSFSDTFTFDLGLDAFLQVRTSGGVSASITPVLNVGFNLNDGVPSLDPTKTGLDINFAIGLPNLELTASLNGFLYAKAVDAGTTFSGKLGFTFDTGFRIQPSFAGDAHVRLGLSLSLVDPALNASFNPRFFTDFELDWGFDTQGSALNVPQIAFRKFSLDADSFMQGFLGDTVKGVQKFTKPLQPFIDMFEQPVPIMNAFDGTETMGDLFLKGAGLSQEQQDRFEMMVRITKAVNNFDFSGTTGGAVINFGDIQLSGDARAAGQFLFDTSALDNVIDDIMNSPVLQEVQDKLETLANYAGFNANAGFKYPLLEKPGPVIGSSLTGQPEVMFSYSTGRQHFDLGASVGFGIPDVLGVFLEAGIVFNANLSVGYDTAGLIKFIQDPQKRPEALLHGFYIDNGVDTNSPPIPGVANPKNTGLYLHGYAQLKATAIATLSGGIYADVTFELASNSTSTRVYLDDIITGLASNTKVFNATGTLYAAANIEVTLPKVVGPQITLFKQEIARLDLLNFNVPRPPTSTVPLTVIDVTNQHTLLLDANKMTPYGYVKVRTFHDMAIDSGNGYLGDGIRVDYPNEIVLYIERKNDVTTNYYNFIGLSGTVPDGVSIDIVDPFTVFSAEGAADPQPAQTESGILLAGGKSVVYRYRESAGGSRANVLMVGGNGSNTLSGGTMIFGNFVPAERLAQAKSHFGNVTGFEPATQAYINARLDSLQAATNAGGIIGATMTSGRGGLMVGGPGNNSFYAEGPGNYDMVGGTWINNFTITPSFSGVPATYQVDGGPYGQSTLIVRVPLDENVGFENSNLDDKYNPALKALAVTANAGLAATAHGIKKVQIVARPGANVSIGDTSLVGAEFAIAGGAALNFGGTSAVDHFYVTTAGPYLGRANHWYVSQAAILYYNNGAIETFINEWTNVLLPPAVYSVTRTFGTNGRTQTTLFAVQDANASSIKLNAGGASDTYTIYLGVGAFIDVEITDTDASTINSLSVFTQDRSLFYNTFNFTDTAIQLDYYTQTYLYTTVPGGTGYYEYDAEIWHTSVHYTPTVRFSPNIAPRLQVASPYLQGTINRPIAAQAAELFVGGDFFFSPMEYDGMQFWLGVWDVTTNPWTRSQIQPNAAHRPIEILANNGSLLVTQQFMEAFRGTAQIPHPYFNVRGNTGALKFVVADKGTYGRGTVVNVWNNSGTIDFLDASIGLPSQPVYISTQVNVGAGGSLANISGAITLSSPSGLIGLRINDNANPGITSPWNVFADKTIIGDLTINHPVNRNGGYLDYVTFYEAFTKAGTAFAYESQPQFYRRVLNGAAFSSDIVVGVSDKSARRGEAITAQVTATSNFPGALSYSATGLPPGLSINSSGLISGTISATATQATYTALIQVSQGGAVGRTKAMTWSIGSSIQIVVPAALTEKRQVEGTAPPLDPLTAVNLFNRPVTFSATNLPPGISLNRTTGRFSGTYAPGSGRADVYMTVFSATDGIDTTTYDFNWSVTGIALATPENQFNRLGDSVSIPLNYSIASGAVGTISVSGLPEGLIYEPVDRRITGTISLNAYPVQTVFITVANGNDVVEASFVWVALPADVTNLIDFDPVSDKHLHEGDSVDIYPRIYNSLGLPLTLSATGLPQGLSIQEDGGYWFIRGTVGSGAAAQSPYRVTLHATDGTMSDSTTLEISVGKVNSVAFRNADYTQFNTPYEIIGVYINAVSSLNEPISYSATGLPPGLTIDPATGLVTGEVPMSSAVPLTYKVTVTATAASGSDQTKFNWNWTASASAPNFAAIAHAQGPITVGSSPGTELAVAYKANPGVSLPADTLFPLGFFEYTIRYVQPGQAADLTFYSLDVTGIDQYSNYGATPANAAAHWYKFLLNQATDSDSALDTGMEIVNGRLVLHLVDGGRGDADLTKNGQITSFGGPSKRASQPPAIANFGGTVTFTENGAPVVLDSDAVVTDVDSANFADGKLTVATAVNAESTDRIRVKHTGNEAGQIGVDGFNIRYGGKLIGTFTGASALVVRLTADATPAAVQALLRSVTYSAVTDAPSTLNRKIRVTLSDGGGGTSLASTCTVSVMAVNDRPVIAGFGGQATYTENGAAVILDSDATVTDVDSKNLDTGKLSIIITGNAEATDRIRIKHMGNGAGQVGVSGTTISYGGVAIGTYTGAKALVITFNAQATPVAVQAVLRNATYFTVSDTPSTLNRTVRVSLTDGDGGTSTLSYKTIQVIAANDAPVIAALGTVVQYDVAGPAIAIAPLATVTDADSTDFDSGSLTIATTVNAQATDVLAIAHQGMGPGQIGISGLNVMFEGRIIGTQAGGTGLAPLKVTFTATASAQSIQALLRSITWRTTPSSPSRSPRTISIDLSDGDDGLTSILKRISL